MKRLLRKCLGEKIALYVWWRMAEFVRLSRLRQATLLLAVVTVLFIFRWMWISVDNATDVLRPATSIWNRSTGEPKTLSPCERFSTTATKKKILIWNMPFEDPAMVPENLFTGHMPTNLYRISWNNSECGNCQISYDQDEFNISDAIVFHGIYPNDTGLTPRKRFQDQKYVWWSQESRLNVRFDRSAAEDFDWTMTPSRHSDIFSPYATFPWILKFLWLKEKGSDVMAKFSEMKTIYTVEEDELDDLLQEYFGNVKKKKRRKSQHPMTSVDELLSKKLRPCTWIASNCRSGSTLNRLYLVEKMESYGMKIDKYGNCNEESIDISRWDPSFFEILSRYKFYLSFENSLHCSDYITEKLWFNALYSGAVPVIWGPHKDDVKDVLPPKSYIFVEDFSSIKDLVKYMKFLDRNETAYSEYLEWRTWLKYLNKFGLYDHDELQKRGRSSQPNWKTRNMLKKYAVMKPVGFCQLCLELHTPPFCRKRRRRDIMRDEREECLDEYLVEEIMSTLGIW